MLQPVLSLSKGSLLLIHGRPFRAFLRLLRLTFGSPACGRQARRREDTKALIKPKARRERRCLIPIPPLRLCVSAGDFFKTEPPASPRLRVSAPACRRQVSFSRHLCVSAGDFSEPPRLRLSFCFCSSCHLCVSAPACRRQGSLSPSLHSTFASSRLRARLRQAGESISSSFRCLLLIRLWSKMLQPVLSLSKGSLLLIHGRPFRAFLRFLRLTFGSPACGRQARRRALRQAQDGRREGRKASGAEGQGVDLNRRKRRKRRRGGAEC